MADLRRSELPVVRGVLVLQTLASGGLLSAAYVIGAKEGAITGIACGVLNAGVMDYQRNCTLFCQMVRDYRERPLRNALFDSALFGGFLLFTYVMGHHLDHPLARQGATFALGLVGTSTLLDPHIAFWTMPIKGESK